MSLFFSPSCPSGGSFYACSSGTYFVGCCNGDPCQGGCSDGNLEPASFDPLFIGKFKDQECSRGSEWYTCTATVPPFLGCCKSNPCTGTTGCPSGDVTAGFLSSNPAVAKDFLPAAASSASASASSATSSSSQTSRASSSPASTNSSAALTTTAAFADMPTHTTSTGTIAGATVGGLAGLGLLVALLAFFLRRRIAKSRQYMAEGRSPSGNSSSMPDKGDAAMGETKHLPFSSTSQSPSSEDYAANTQLPAPQPSTPAPMYTPYRTERSELDSPSDSPFSSPPAQELPSPYPSPMPQNSITPFTPNHIFPTLGSYSDGLGVSNSNTAIHPPTLHSTFTGAGE